MKKVLVLGLILIAAGCKSGKITADSPEKYRVENLAKVISQRNLEEIYPDAQIAEGVDLFDEGTVERPYSILYPETKDQLLIIWEDQSRTRPYQLYVENEGKWSTQNGIMVGTSYEDLQAINGGSIKFYGFGWDYSGAVDWNDGKLADSNIRVFLAPVQAPPQSFYGDQIIEADPEEILNLDLRVRALMLHNGQ